MGHDGAVPGAADDGWTHVSRALLVVDVQGEYDGGALPIAWPPADQSLPNVRRAIGAATARGIPLVVVQQTGPADPPALATGSPGWQLLDVMDGVEADLAVEKALPSAFAGTQLLEDVHRHTPRVLQSRFAAVPETAEWVRSLDSGVVHSPTGLLPSAAAALETSGTS